VRVAIVTTLAATAVFVAGCGAVDHISSSEFTPADMTAGKALFVKSCGDCHTLANAKTTAVIGPDLDDAFGPDKAQGFHLSTIADVVRGQIAYPDTHPGTETNGVLNPGMTANLLHGQQARDVAIYVAECSARPSCTFTAVPRSG
jgi:mono/diheme cytochrome c family protein